MTAEDLDGLQYDVMTLIGDLETLHGFVISLTTTRQHGLGFLTPAGRAALDAQVATDRRYRTTQPERRDQAGNLVVGMDWLNRDADVIPTGHVRAPGSVPAISVEADAHFTLQQLAKHVETRLELADILCVLSRLPDEPTIFDLLAHLRSLTVLARSMTLLGYVHRELERLKDDAQFVVDGDNRTQLEDRCPHCGEKTLVVFWDRTDAANHVIRCDRHPRTGHYLPCICPDQLCECKVRPIAYRHHWERNPAAAGDRHRTWGALNNLLVTRRAAT